MHPGILSAEQQAILPVVKRFARTFYMAGDTAIALHIGHRRSIDFDLFSAKAMNKARVRTVFRSIEGGRVTILHEDVDQLHLIFRHVKITFLHYPFDVDASCKLKDVVRLPPLLTLAAMKAYALGRRSKWKDYVDLCFILRDHFSMDEISREAGRIFGDLFSEKLFRQQLAFHEDIDYSEEVEFMPGYMVDDEAIRAYLIEAATGIL